MPKSKQIKIGCMWLPILHRYIFIPFNLSGVKQIEIPEPQWLAYLKLREAFEEAHYKLVKKIK